MVKSRKFLGAAALLALVVAPVLAASTLSRGRVSDMPVTGAAAVFTSALTVAGGRVTNPTTGDPGKSVWWNITVGIKAGSTTSKVYLRHIIDGDTSQDQVLNEDALLTAGALYGFSVQVHPDETYNVVLGTTTHLTTLKVEEEP